MMIQHRCDAKLRIYLQALRAVLRTNCRDNMLLPPDVALDHKTIMLVCMIKDYDQFSVKSNACGDDLTGDIHKLGRGGVEIW